MHSHTLDDWHHDHVFLGAAHDRNERHTWRVGPGHHAAFVSLLGCAFGVEAYKDRLAELPRLSPVTVEVHRCNHTH